MQFVAKNYTQNENFSKKFYIATAATWRLFRQFAADQIPFKVTELVGVNRQVVTKWEINQSPPNTENLFKLAKIFGTMVDLLLDSDEELSNPPVGCAIFEQSAGENFYPDIQNQIINAAPIIPRPTPT